MPAQLCGSGPAGQRGSPRHGTRNNQQDIEIVARVIEGKWRNDTGPVRQNPDEPLTRQKEQRLPDRCAGYLEPGRKRELVQRRTRLDPKPQDFLSKNVTNLQRPAAPALAGSRLVIPLHGPRKPAGLAPLAIA